MKEGSTCVVSLTRDCRLVPVASLPLIYSLLHYFFTFLYSLLSFQETIPSLLIIINPFLLKTMFLFSLSYFAYLHSKVLLVRNYSFDSLLYFPMDLNNGKCHLCFSKCPQKVTPDHPTLTHLSFFPNSGHVH